jgi:hypothetical protein
MERTEEINNYEEKRHALFLELYKELPSHLQEEFQAKIAAATRRRTVDADPSDDSFIRSIILNAIIAREVDRQFPPLVKNSWLAHYRVAELLKDRNVKILNVGNKGYPDLLLEVRGEVIGVEVKGKGDRLQTQQKVVLDALTKLRRVFVVRESGKKVSNDELSLDEFLSQLSIDEHKPK